MSKTYSPSDYNTNTIVDYDTAKGYYCSGEDIVSLLQIPFDSATNQFSASTSPNAADVGKIIKRVEDWVDERIGFSYRPNIYSDEFHNFTFRRWPFTLQSYYIDYVGFLQLTHVKVRKILQLDVWQGTTWKSLASSAGKITLNSNYNNLDYIKITLPDGDYFQLDGSNVFGASLPAGDFNKKLGVSTTALELVALINERYPTLTQQFTQQDEKKTLLSNAGTKSISDYFYASLDLEDSNVVSITSLLPGDDGDECVLTQSSTGDDGCTLVDFKTTGVDKKRKEDWWMIGDEGKLFFRTEYPYINNNSIRVTYLAGATRVPAYINEAATKLVCAELLRHDDSTIMIAESGAQIDIKGKYDELRKDANAILDSKRKIAFLISD